MRGGKPPAAMRMLCVVVHLTVCLCALCESRRWWSSRAAHSRVFRRRRRPWEWWRRGQSTPSGRPRWPSCAPRAPPASSASCGPCKAQLQTQQHAGSVRLCCSVHSHAHTHAQRGMRHPPLVRAVQVQLRAVQRDSKAGLVGQVDVAILGQRLVREHVAEQGHDLVRFRAQHQVLSQHAMTSRETPVPRVRIPHQTTRRASARDTCRTAVRTSAMRQLGNTYCRWYEYTLLPCGITGMSYADASATMRRASVMPPHQVMSGCKMSAHFFSSSWLQRVHAHTHTPNNIRKSVASTDGNL